MASPPEGQGLIEFLVVSLALGLLIGGFSGLYSLAQGRVKLLEASRFVSDRCRASEAICRDVQAAQTVFDRHWGDPRAPISSIDDVKSPRDKASVVARFDAPTADVSGASGLSGLHVQTMGYLLQLGGGLFDLPDARSLRRVSVSHEVMTHWGEFKQEERLASLADYWTATTRQQAQDRIDRGARPLLPLEQTIRLGQAPAIDLLLPTFEFVGLESGSDQFRDRFKQGDWMRTYSHVTP